MTPNDHIEAAQGHMKDAERLLRERLTTETGRLRGRLQADLWTLRRMAGMVPNHFSQFGQDWLVDRRLLQGKTGGVFVDIGGYDGVKGSNTLYFEQMRGWTGLLAEPAPDRFAEASARRRCPCEQVAVAGHAGEAEFVDIVEGYTQMSGLLASYDPETLARVRADPRHRETMARVRTEPLSDILDRHGLVRIDYLSLDVEGGEREILECFAFDDYEIAVWSIENAGGDPAIPAVMRAQGYQLVEFLGVDDIYARPDLLPQG